MGKTLCRIFSFFLGIFEQTLDVVTKSLIAVGTAAVEVLNEVASSLTKSIMSSPLVWGIGLIAAYYFISGMEEDDPKVTKPADDPSNNEGFWV